MSEPSLQNVDNRVLIKSHSKISKSVSKCLKLFGDTSKDPSLSIVVVQIEADAKAAGKAITIAEIVKRRLHQHGRMVTQSNRVQETVLSAAEPEKAKTKTHLQDEGFEKARKRLEAQLMNQLELKRVEE